MGGFATGFFSALGDKANSAMDRRADELHEEKKRKADMYWKVIQNPESQKADIDEANAQLDKLYPKDPRIKQMLDKFRQLHASVHPSAQQTPQTGPDAPLEGGGVPRPPQPGVASGTPGATPGTADPAKASAIPPPPQPAAAAKPSFADLAHRAAGPTQKEQDEHRFQTWKRQQDILKQNKIEEEQAKAKADADAKAANPTGRPVMGPAVSVRNARDAAKQGAKYLDVDGNPIDLTTMPDSMGLKFVAWGGKHYYVPFSPNSKIITVGNETYAVSPMDVEALGSGAGTDLGQHAMPSTTATTDPATQQTTVAKHVPVTTGAKSRAGGAATSGAGTTPPAIPSVPPAKSSPSAKSTSGTGTSRIAAPLDPDDHIPASTKGSPQVIEGANQLLDGKDVDKLPTKTRDLSAKLARSYGWEQGRFTPKEQTMLREATTFIDDTIKNDKALAVLDEGWFDRQKVAQVVDSVDAKGMISRAITTTAAQNLTDDEAEFVRAYNQLVGTISGFGQLVRSGRATEATIERLKKELPNPMTTKDSADAMERLKRLRREIDVGLQKGTFTGVTASSSRKSSIAPPPKPGEGQVSQAAQDFLKSQGVPVGP